MKVSSNQNSLELIGLGCSLFVHDEDLIFHAYKDVHGVTSLNFVQPNKTITTFN